MSTAGSKIMAAVHGIRRLRRALPLGDVLRVTHARKTTREIRVFLKAIGKKVIIRGGTTDLKCLMKVFSDGEYELPFDTSPQVIVDAGANIGMATLYFAARYPKAKVVALEPELSNFKVLEQNCRDLSNAILLRGALWPVSASLQIDDSSVDAWAFRVSQGRSKHNTEVIPAITLPQIFDLVGAERIDLLKIDIEGSELELFSNGPEQWIDRVHVIAIELHDRFRPGCQEAFYSALGTRSFTQEIRGENIFVKMIRGSDPPATAPLHRPLGES
jgi:FkbM family methyltransferase